MGIFQNSNLSVGSMRCWNGSILPSSYPTLWLWLDANDMSTITTGSVDPVVSTWADKSGGGRNFTQATVGSRPTYQATSFNGKPSISFDGNDFLTYSSVTSYSKFTVFAVLNVQNNASMDTQDIFNKVYYYALNFNDFPFRGIAAGKTVTSLGAYIDSGNDYSTDAFSTSSASPNVNYLFTSYYDQVNLITSINGVTGQITPSSLTLSSTAAPYAIGRAGANNGAGTDKSFYKGNIAELIMYTSSLSTSQQADIRNYLGAKWGISTL